MTAKKRVVHKADFRDRWADTFCGLNWWFWNSKRLGKWDKVTCKRCLARKSK